MAESTVKTGAGHTSRFETRTSARAEDPDTEALHGLANQHRDCDFSVEGTIFNS